ncbi:MAG: tetratricopeptide repeat protein, partial [Bdellovibrionota bacterium]
MKKLLLVCVLSSSLFSCSLLQRRGGGPDEETEGQPTEAAGDPAAPLFTASGQEVTPAASTAAGAESEVSRLNTKVAALETKLDVLSASMERLQAQKSQPVIQAEPAQPQAHLAAPVDENASASSSNNSEIEDRSAPQISAAPVKPARLPSIPKNLDAGPSSAKSTSAAEREFRAAMQLFQNGQNLDAASRFALMAKKFPHHMLAAHALYWAGEASARGQQWPIAVDNWAELEKHYPRSAYVPEALAGLARAYDAQGDATKAKYYRSMLLQSFPKSPVAMKAEPVPAVDGTRGLGFLSGLVTI